MLSDLRRFRGNPPGLRSFLQQAQNTSPLRYDSGAKCWVALGYSDVRSLLEDPNGCFRSGPPRFQEALPPAGELAGIVRRQFLFLDGERHSRIQAFLQPEIARRSRELESFLSNSVDELLGRARLDLNLDLVSRFSAPLSRRMMARFLGVPESDNAAWLSQLADWSDALTNVTSGSTWGSLQGVEKLYRAFAKIVEAKHRWPEDDLLSAYIDYVLQERLRDSEELISDAMMLFAAGIANIRKIIPGVISELLSTDGQMERLRSDLLHDAVTQHGQQEAMHALTEEALRLGVSTSYVARWTTSETTLGSVVIPAGAKILLFLEAANLDEKQFPDAQRFDLHRSPNPHLSFGAGPHACPAAPLARMILQTAFRGLLALSDLRLASQRTDRWYANDNLGGLTMCPVFFSP